MDAIPLQAQPPVMWQVSVFAMHELPQAFPVVHTLQQLDGVGDGEGDGLGDGVGLGVGAGALLLGTLKLSVTELPVSVIR